MGKKGKTREELISDIEELQKSLLSSKLISENEIAELRKSEEKFRKAYMTSPDSININRISDGMYISINSGFTRIMGYDEDDIIGKTSLEMNIWASPDDRSNVMAELTRNGQIRNYEAEFISKSGTKVTGSMSASLIKLDDVPHILSVTRDITAHKRALQALDREKSLMEALMNTLPDHIYFKDTESKFIRNSRSHVFSFGFNTPDQIAGKSDFDFFTEEAARKAYDDEQKIITTGQPIIKEEQLTRKDNTVVWFSAMKLPLLDKDGKITGTFGISRDITEKKNAEEALKHSEERFRSVAMSANDAIVTVDGSENIIGWNRSAERIFGYNEQEIFGKTLSHIIPDEYKSVQTKILKIMKEGGGGHMTGRTVELEGLRKNGESFPVELSFSGWETSEGQFFTGIIRDISNRKRTELENQVIFEITRGVSTTSNLDELLELIHNTLSKAVYAENFFIALHNHKTDLFSFPYFIDKNDPTPEPTSMGKSCTAYVYKTRKPLLLTQAVFDNLLEQNEVELVGSPSPSWIGIPLQSPSDVLGVLVLQHYEREDIYSDRDMNFLISIASQIAFAIERKKAEEEIRLKNELLQTLNAEKDKFFSILAHDLKGPMSAFVSATQILTEDIQTMSLEDIREITIALKTDATNIYKLLENLLEWSRLQRGVMEFNPIQLNLKDAINKAVETVLVSARRKGISIEVSIVDDTEVTADSHMFETVVRNFVSNAVKFTSAGGKVIVTGSIIDNNRVEIKIADTGIGMPPDLRAKLFLLNEKTSRKGTDGEPSSGLGLLLCKEFIEKHAGKIKVESEVGKGSAFTFSLPLESSKKV